MASAPLHLLDADLDELRRWVVVQGEQRYRADQIAEWVFGKGAIGFDEMSNLSRSLRTWLAEHARIYRSTITGDSAAADGTRKLLLTWPDKSAAETVWIPEDDRNTVCVSSQVGCAIGCHFCASGLGGLQRNLSAGEIVEQALCVRGLIEGPATQEAQTTHRPRLTNVVLMGMGEPLANYDAVIKAVRIMNAPWGLGIGARKITISTVGLPRQIRRLAEEGLQVNLALSLHAPDDALRRELIPGNKASIDALLEACTHYFKQTGREVTLEYVLLQGVNDGVRQAEQLARLATRLRCNVNLLRYNAVSGLPYERPTAAAAYEFQRRLRACGVNAHVRRSRGPDIDAACGQLRHLASRSKD